MNPIKILFIMISLIFLGCVTDEGDKWEIVRDEVFALQPGTLQWFGVQDPNISGDITLKWSIESDQPVEVDVVASTSDVSLKQNGLSYINYPSLYSLNVLKYEREGKVSATNQTVIANYGSASANVTFKIWVK